MQNFDAQKLELDRIRYTLTIEQRRVGEIEIQLEEKENKCILLLEEKNVLKSQLSRIEEDRRTEGRNVENMILEKIMKARDEDLRTKERSLAELRESSLKEQLALKENILLLEKNLLLIEREAGKNKTYVQHCTSYSTCTSTASCFNCYYFLISLALSHPLYTGHSHLFHNALSYCLSAFTALFTMSVRSVLVLTPLNGLIKSG